MAKEKDFFTELSEQAEGIKIIDSKQMFSCSDIPYGIKTGLPEIELALSRPGWPAHHITELYGFEGCGKTTLGYHALANMQARGGLCFFIDSEMSFDGYRASKCGVSLEPSDFRKMDVKTTDQGFMGLNAICKSSIESKNERPILVVYDSVTGTQTEYDKDKNIVKDKDRVGQEARVIRRGIKQINSRLGDAKVTVIFINHSIAKISAMAFAKKSQAAGGHALKFFSFARVEMAKIGQLHNGKKLDERVLLGDEISLELVKSKVGPRRIPPIQAELSNDFGFDTVDSMFKAMRRSGQIEKVNNLISRFEGLDFRKGDWASIVTDQGGIDIMYDKFYEFCYDKKLMRPYENSNI